MNPSKEYQIALELASTLRYGEAERVLARIIEAEPGHIDALILMGKVEYYLRRRSASRAAFETVLLYEPENTTAYFGLQFFRERSRNIRNAVSLASMILLLIATGIALFFGLSAAFTARLSGVSENLDSQVARFEQLIEESSALRAAAEESSAGKLAELSEELVRNTVFLEAIQRSTQIQIDKIGDTITRLDEFQTSRNRLIDYLRREIQNLRFEAYRFR